jgi:hypothetical protein
MAIKGMIRLENGRGRRRKNPRAIQFVHFVRFLISAPSSSDPILALPHTYIPIVIQFTIIIIVEREKNIRKKNP